MMQHYHDFQQIIHCLEQFHPIDANEIEKLNSAYDLLKSNIINQPDDPLLLRSIEVAQYIASWRFDHTVVIAAMLHSLVTHNIIAINDLKTQVEEATFNILKGYVDIYQQITHSNSYQSSGSKEIDISQLISLYPESFYVLIAEHVVILSRKLSCNDDSALALAQQTREMLIPQVKRINAYKMVDMLEEMCFQTERKTIYHAIHSVIDEIEELNGFYRKQFLTRLRQIFDPNSNIVPPELKAVQSYIKFFQENRRSLVSLYRFITRTDSGSTPESNIYDDLKKVKNICRTAYYDLTLVVSDTITQLKNYTLIDFFMDYFESMLRPDGVFLYGFYYTTSRDSCYFLFSDPMKNMYRFFIKSESDYLHYMYGDIINRDKYSLSCTPRKDQNKIKIFRKDGSPEFVEQGTTVLDFAFRIHEDLGLHFGCAKLNNNGKAMPPFTVLSNGDTIEIIKSDRITADLNWFRYVKTDLATNYLIKFYKTQYLQSGNMIRIATKDRQNILIQEGATVLDFAFAIQGNMGLYFSYALINGQKKHFTLDHILTNGDTVEIIKAHTIQANIDWFRHLKTPTAINHLIDHFKQPGC